MESFSNCAEQSKNAQTTGQMCEESPSNEKPSHNLPISWYVQLLKATNRLTDDAWSSLLEILQLPLQIEELSAGQARWLEHLLQYLIVHSPLTKQIGTTPEHWHLWLNEYLPESFKPYLLIATAKIKNKQKRQIQATKQSSTGQTKKKSKKKSAKQNFDITTSESQNKFPRKAVSPALFSEVAIRQGSFCFWCGIKVIRESQIPMANRFAKNGMTIVFLTADGELREEAFATVDHLLRVTDGGTNDPANLVISCFGCNNERAKATIAYNRPFARRRLPCKNCGGRFFHPDWGGCSICGAILQHSGRLNELFRKAVSFIKNRWQSQTN